MTDDKKPKILSAAEVDQLSKRWGSEGEGARALSTIRALREGLAVALAEAGPCANKNVRCIYHKTKDDGSPCPVAKAHELLGEKP